MPYFMAKMHQIRFQLDLRPKPHWRSSSQRSPDSLARFEGFYNPTSKEKEEKGEGNGKREGEVKPPNKNSGYIRRCIMSVLHFYALR